MPILEIALALTILVVVGAFMHREYLYTSAHEALISMLPQRPIPYVLFIRRVRLSEDTRIQRLLQAVSMHLDPSIRARRPLHNGEIAQAVAHRAIDRLIVEGVATHRMVEYSNAQLRQLLVHHGEVLGSQITKSLGGLIDTQVPDDEPYIRIATIKLNPNPGIRERDPRGWGH